MSGKRYWLGSCGDASDWPVGVLQFLSGVNCTQMVIEAFAEVVFVVIHVHIYVLLCIIYNNNTYTYMSYLAWKHSCS